MTTGWASQETGDWGEAFVKATLAREQFTVIELKPDLGEEFLIEIEGRRAVAEGLCPRRALIQVKTQSGFFDSDLMKVVIPLKAINRWSAQPLPIFIVGVSGRDTPSLYMTSLDDVLTESLQGRDPTQCEQETVTVSLKIAPTLPEKLSSAIEEFTRTQVPDFQNLTKEEIEANHFEILKKKIPSASQEFVMVVWSILWKSPRRPKFFSAMFRELIKQAKVEYAAIDKPVHFVFCIYRSLRDQQHNMAVAYVDWADIEDRRFGGIEKLFPWAPYCIRPGHDNDESRRFIAGRTATAHEFIECVRKIGTLLDGITAIILSKETTVEGLCPWNADLTNVLNDADRLWNKMPQAPTELALVDKFISNYINALDDNRWMRDPTANITQSQRERWYPQNISALVGYYLAWTVLLKTSGW